jgi:hypothetical protein
MQGRKCQPGAVASPDDSLTNADVNFSNQAAYVAITAT